MKNREIMQCIQSRYVSRGIAVIKQQIMLSRVITIAVSFFLLPFCLLCTGLCAGCSSVHGRTCHLSSDGKCDSMSLVESVRAGDKFYGYPMNTFEGKPIRSGENVQQIWIGPYEDNDGNYHEPSYIYSVTKKGQWIGEPVKEIQD